MADGRDDAADQLKQWKSQRGSQVPAGHPRFPRASHREGSGERGASAPEGAELRRVPRDAGAPSARASPDQRRRARRPRPVPASPPRLGAVPGNAEARRDGGCQLARSDKGAQRCLAPAAPSGQQWGCAAPKPRSAGRDGRWWSVSVLDQKCAVRCAATAVEPCENVTRE